MTRESKSGKVPQKLGSLGVRATKLPLSYNVLLCLIAPILGVSSGLIFYACSTFWVGCRVTCSGWWFASTPRFLKSCDVCPQLNMFGHMVPQGSQFRVWHGAGRIFVYPHISFCIFEHLRPDPLKDLKTDTQVALIISMSHSYGVVPWEAFGQVPARLLQGQERMLLSDSLPTSKTCTIPLEPSDVLSEA